ncbi:hypothetical protein, partial [Micromonospora sp. NPDC051296]|uniref:hypothetical protein n=1 Tax=Micromonospora sp. NPDC051296 TaxID=3155046 RepID=UPI003427F3C1
LHGFLGSGGPGQGLDQVGGGASRRVAPRVPVVPLDQDPEVTADVPGLMLPDGARVTSVIEQGVLTSVEATVRMSPLDVRAHYEQRTDIDLLRVEDEIFETEVLARAQDRRMYLRAGALCADATTLTVMVGPDSDEAGLPEFRSG